MTAGFTLAAAAVIAPPVLAKPLLVPFDFSRMTLGINVAIKGTPLFVMVDTGVDPSIIDLARADALGLEVDRGNSGEGNGVGSGKGQTVFPASIAGLTIGSRSFGKFNTLASDMSAFSQSYGRPIDGVLGYSFLSDKIVLIDYPRRSLGILDQAAEARPLTRRCKLRWKIPLKTSDGFPIIPNFRFGGASGAITLDTGSNSGIGLFPNALNLPGLRANMVENGAVTHSGFQGNTTSKTYTIGARVGFGPFSLPAGQVATLHTTQWSTADHVANVGNRLFAAMKLKMLLDYRAKSMTFFGSCH